MGTWYKLPVCWQSVMCCTRRWRPHQVKLLLVRLLLLLVSPIALRGVGLRHERFHRATCHKGQGLRTTCMPRLCLGRGWVGPVLRQGT